MATTKKTLDLKAERAKTEFAFDDIRLQKLDALVTAKLAHNVAVNKAKSDEMAAFKTQLENFSKRVPFLCTLAKKLEIVGTVPVTPVKLTTPRKYEYKFSAFKYVIKYGDDGVHWCIGIRDNDKTTVNFYVVNENGVWLDSRVANKTIFATNLCPSAGPGEYSGPNVKEFMLAAFEWEKELLNAIDQL